MGQLHEVLTQLKTMAHANPDQTRQVLFQNPQLTYAVVQMMLVMGIVDATIIQQMLQNAQTAQTLGYRTAPSIFAPFFAGAPGTLC